MEELNELYQATTDPEAVSAAEERLSELYEDPQTVFAQIELLSSDCSETVKNACSIGLKAALDKNWESIRQSENNPILKNSLISILSDPKNISRRSLLIAAIFPVICTDACEWEEFLQLIESLSSSTEPHTFTFYLKLMCSSYEYLPQMYVTSTLGAVCERLIQALSSTNNEIVLAGAELLLKMVKIVVVAPDFLLEVLRVASVALTTAIAAKSGAIDPLISSLSMIVLTKDDFIEPNALFELFIGMLNEESIPAQDRCLVAELIVAAIQKFPDYARSISSEIITVVATVGSAAVNPELSFDEQDDVILIASVVEALCSVSDEEEFFDAFYSVVSEASEIEHLIFASAALCRFLELIPETVATKFSVLLSIIQQCLGAESNCCKEGGLSVAQICLERNSSLFMEQSNEFVELLFSCFDESADDSMIQKTLVVLTQFLYTTEIEPQLIEPMIEKFTALIEPLPGYLLHFLITAITALIDSAGDLVKPFAETLLPIISQAALEGEESSILQLRGIESLAAFASICPDEASEVIENLLELIDSCLSDDDNDTIVCGLTALKFLISSNHKFYETTEPFNQYLIKALSNNDDANESLKEAHQLSFNIISMSAKKGLVTEDAVPVLIKCAANAIEGSATEVQSAALNALVNLHLATSTPIDELIPQLNSFLSSKKQAPIAFRCFSKLIKKKMISNEEMLQMFIKDGLDGLNNDLPCQQLFFTRDDAKDVDDEDDDDTPVDEFSGLDNNKSVTFDLRDEIIDFFANVATYFPQNFPLGEFWQTATTFRENEEQIDVFNECLSVLVELFDSNYEGVPPLFKKAICAAFVDMTELLDFDLPPHYINGIRCFIEKENSASEELIEQINSFYEQTLELGFDGQAYYWSTVAATVSLEFSVLRIATGSFKTDLLESMFTYIPQHTSMSDADNELHTLALISTNAEIMGAFSEQIIRVLIQFLAMSDKKWKKLDIHEENIKEACAALKTIILSSQTSLDALIEANELQICSERIQNRML